MNEKYLICTRDFRNVIENGKIAGFQVKVKIPYYRGIAVSLIEKLGLSVDGENFGRDRIKFTIGNRTMTMDEVDKAVDVRWPFDQTATLTVSKEGGLSTGMHTVKFDITIRKSYWPKNDPEKLYAFGPISGTAYFSPESATKKMTLVQ